MGPPSKVEPINSTRNLPYASASDESTSRAVSIVSLEWPVSVSLDMPSGRIEVSSLFAHRRATLSQARRPASHLLYPPLGAVVEEVKQSGNDENRRSHGKRPGPVVAGSALRSGRASCLL